MPKKKKSVSATVKAPAIPTIIKRDGRIVPFDVEKITNAVLKGLNTMAEGSREDAELVAKNVLAELVRIKKKFKNFMPTVEGVQDIVEQELMRSDYVKTAKHYVLYREERAQLRAKGVEIPENVRKLATDSKQYFRNALGEFVYYRTYSKWIDAESRRETWIETVERYITFMKENLGNKLTDKEYKEVRDGILSQQAMPSMRLLQFSGPAARRDNVCAYNCSFIAPESFQDLAEIMYVSMSGTGVGFAVESTNAEKFPQIALQTGEKNSVHVVGDSKEGWADSLVVGMKAWAAGKDVDFDYSTVRPEGTRLKIMGGKASGPAPLVRLHGFTRQIMLARQGKRLRPIDLHDIICMIGDCVVSGGVRRSAMISLSELADEQIRDAKKGAFYVNHPHRMLANNSAVYINKPSNEEFLKEWMALIESRSGERGIFNRGSLAKTLPERRIAALKEYKGYFDPSGQHIVGPMGTNPCGEIILQSKQFCNLSEIVARADDTEATLMKKMRLATILGTYQSSLTNFQYLSKEWKEHCDRERLLGVSITGQWDCPVVRKPEVMRKLKAEAIRINKEYAKRFGIGESTAITTVKPSGTLSQTVDCSSGMHPRHAKFYIRRVRISATDTLFKMLKDQGVPYHPEVGQTMETASTYVLEFPVKAPSGSIFRDDLSAIEQLEYWKMVKTNYTEHNPSVTVSIGNDEWIAVANWVYENWDIAGGLSFLPREDAVYKLAPYEAIDEKRFKDLAKRLEHIDYSKIISYEKQNEIDMKKELACAGGVCEIV
ncbi:MAG: ATP cone domain-containing protein [Candidatus Pacebacteria bacterium]|nr:ATP cone domain-containing protein [Candidatus Paceibacterota bacterium]